MARTQIPNTAATTMQPTGPASGTTLNPTFTAADVLNGNYFVATGRDLVEVYNSDTVAHSFSVLSAPDDVGRKADVINYSIPASTDVQTKGHVSFLLLPSSLYTQTDGTVQISADNVAVSFLVRSL